MADDPLRCLADRLRALEDREALQELIARYADYTARADIDAMVACYATDGCFGTPAHMRPKAELPAFFRQNVLPQQRIPLVVNQVLTIAGDLAEGTSTMFSPWSPEGAFCGHYRDRFRREAGAWKFVERVWTYYRDPAV